MRWTLLLALLSITGCVGRIDYTNPRTGEKVSVIQPPKAIAPATLRWSTTQPGFEASTGSGQLEDKAAESRSSTLVWAGVALMVLAVVGFVLRAYLPVIPLEAVLALGGLGLLLVMLPTLNPLVFWIGLLLVGTILVIGWWENHSHLTSSGKTWTGASALESKAVSVASTLLAGASK